jgi:hypothetical protein
VPKTPSFELDVKPIFAAHCVRCHGAGGTLNADPRAPDKNAPSDGYLDRYADKSDCTPDAAGDVPPTCERGALSEAKNGYLKLYLHFTNQLRMPLAPSEPLTSWELETVDNWLAETPTAMP